MTERLTIERKYSIDEIDSMRSWIKRAWFYDRYNSGYKPHERTKEIEEILRTYMMASTDPEELEKEGMRRQEEHWEREREAKKWQEERDKKDNETFSGLEAVRKPWWKR